MAKEPTRDRPRRRPEKKKASRNRKPKAEPFPTPRERASKTRKQPGSRGSKKRSTRTVSDDGDFVKVDQPRPHRLALWTIFAIFIAASIVMVCARDWTTMVSTLGTAHQLAPTDK